MSITANWRRNLVGLLLLALGGLFLAENLTDFNFAWSEWWPVSLIVLGVMLASSSRWVGGFFILWGAIFLVDTLDILSVDIGDFWPLILVAAGLLILFGGWARRPKRRRQRQNASNAEATADELDVSCVFGRIDHRVTSQHFRGGKVSATFGAARIDLRGAALAGGEATLQVETIFGSAEVLVPDDWMVNVQTDDNFSSVDLKRAQPSAPTATLTLSGSCTFGGVTIAN